MPIQKWSDAIWVTQLFDEPGLLDDLDTLIAELSRAARVPDVVLDLSQLTYVNSSSLAAMLRVRKLVVEADARLRVASPPNAVWAVLLSTGLDKVFTFSGDVPTALAELQLS